MCACVLGCSSWQRTTMISKTQIRRVQTRNLIHAKYAPVHRHFMRTHCTHTHTRLLHVRHSGYLCSLILSTAQAPSQTNTPTHIWDVWGLCEVNACSCLLTFYVKALATTPAPRLLSLKTITSPLHMRSRICKRERRARAAHSFRPGSRCPTSTL